MDRYVFLSLHLLVERDICILNYFAFKLAASSDGKLLLFVDDNFGKLVSSPGTDKILLPVVSFPGTQENLLALGPPPQMKEPTGFFSITPAATQET